jgi:hypothetical protein
MYTQSLCSDFWEFLASVCGSNCTASPVLLLLPLQCPKGGQECRGDQLQCSGPDAPLGAAGQLWIPNGSILSSRIRSSAVSSASGRLGSAAAVGLCAKPKPTCTGERARSCVRRCYHVPAFVDDALVYVDERNTRVSMGFCVRWRDGCALRVCAWAAGWVGG